eukprot:g5844.t1
MNADNQTNQAAKETSIISTTEMSMLLQVGTSVSFPQRKYAVILRGSAAAHGCISPGATLVTVTEAPMPTIVYPAAMTTWRSCENQTLKWVLEGISSKEVEHAFSAGMDVKFCPLDLNLSVTTCLQDETKQIKFAKGIKPEVSIDGTTGNPTFEYSFTVPGQKVLAAGKYLVIVQPAKNDALGCTPGASNVDVSSTVTVLIEQIPSSEFNVLIANKQYQHGKDEANDDAFLRQCTMYPVEWKFPSSVKESYLLMSTFWPSASTWTEAIDLSPTDGKIYPLSNGYILGRQHFITPPDKTPPGEYVVIVVPSKSNDGNDLSTCMPSLYSRVKIKENEAELFEPTAAQSDMHRACNYNLRFKIGGKTPQFHSNFIMICEVNKDPGMTQRLKYPSQYCQENGAKVNKFVINADALVLLPTVEDFAEFEYTWSPKNKGLVNGNTYAVWVKSHLIGGCDVETSATVLRYYSYDGEGATCKDSFAKDNVQNSAYKSSSTGITVLVFVIVFVFLSTVAYISIKFYRRLHKSSEIEKNETDKIERRNTLLDVPFGDDNEDLSDEQGGGVTIRNRSADTMKSKDIELTSSLSKDRNHEDEIELAKARLIKEKTEAFNKRMKAEEAKERRRERKQRLKRFVSSGILNFESEVWKPGEDKDLKKKDSFDHRATAAMIIRQRKLAGLDVKHQHKKAMSTSHRWDAYEKSLREKEENVKKAKFHLKKARERHEKAVAKHEQTKKEHFDHKATAAMIIRQRKLAGLDIKHQHKKAMSKSHGWQEYEETQNRKWEDSEKRAKMIRSNLDRASREMTKAEIHLDEAIEAHEKAKKDHFDHKATAALIIRQRKLSGLDVKHQHEKAMSKSHSWKSYEEIQEQKYQDAEKKAKKIRDALREKR